MPKFSIIIQGNGVFQHLELAVDRATRRIDVGKQKRLGLEDVSKLDSEAYLLVGISPEQLKLPPSLCISADEISFLAFGQVECAGRRGLFQRAECEEGKGWMAALSAASPDEAAMAVVQSLVELFSILEGISELLRYSIEKIASDTGFPTALVNFGEGDSIFTDRYYHPADLRKEMPARVKAGTDTALDALRNLPRQEQVFARLKAGGYDGASYEYRPQQEQFANEVLGALENEKHLLIEAGTGVGKSLGYLIPAVRHALSKREAVLVSTNTKILQDQLSRSDYPKLCELLGYRLPPPVVLKGRENYLCLEKLRLHVLGSAQELRELVADLRDVEDGRTLALALIRLALHIAVGVSGDFEHVHFPPWLNIETVQRLRRTLSAAFRGCLRDRCPLQNSCYYYAQRDAAEKSPLIILNHALLFAWARPGMERDDQMASFVDKAPIWVLDEAHNLEEVFLDQMGTALASNDIIEMANSLQRLAQSRMLGMRLGVPASEVPQSEQDAFSKLKKLQSALPGYGESCYECFRSLSSIVDQAFHRLSEESGGDTRRWDFTEPENEGVAEFKEEMIGAVALLYDRILEMGDGLTTLAEETAGNDDGFFYIDDNRYQIQLREAVNLFASLKEACQRLLCDENTWVKWIEVSFVRRRELFWVMACCPVVVEDNFLSLMGARKSALLVSGTVSIHGSFDYIKRSLGISGLSKEVLKEVILSSPFNFKESSLVIIPSDMPEPNFRERQAHEKYLEALSEITVEAIRVFGGATLALFNSYADLRSVTKLCEDLCGDEYTLLTQERGMSKHQLVDEFRRGENTALFGVRSFWEGFDIKGEDLQCVIISRFPFPNLHEPLIAGKARYIDKHGGNSFSDYMLPYAIMKFTQGFGRLIRSTEDYGCVLLLDGRALSKGYGMSFLRNLPGPTIVKLPRREVGREMREFLSQRKRRNECV